MRRETKFLVWYAVVIVVITFIADASPEARVSRGTSSVTMRDSRRPQSPSVARHSARPR